MPAVERWTLDVELVAHSAMFMRNIHFVAQYRGSDNGFDRGMFDDLPSRNTLREGLYRGYSMSSEILEVVLRCI